GGGAPGGGGGDHRPRVQRAVGGVAGEGQGDACVEQRAASIEIGQVVGVDPAAVVVAADGEEAGLGDDRLPLGAQGADGVPGDQGAVFDAVAREGADLVEDGEQEQQGDPAHAVHGHRAAAGVGSADEGAQVAEIHWAGIGDDDLVGAGGDRVGEAS